MDDSKKELGLSWETATKFIEFLLTLPPDEVKILIDLCGEAVNNNNRKRNENDMLHSNFASLISQGYYAHE